VLKSFSNSVLATRRFTGLVWTALVFAALGLAQTGGAAKVVAIAGQVTVLRGAAPWALNEGDIILPMQAIRTGPDGSVVFKVADGSTFNVYPNSQVVFRANAGDWKDLVDVILGKIKVKIEHFGNVPNHNTVRTPTAVIAVRGTIFDVDVSEADETTAVLCEEGRVEVFHLMMPGKSRVLDPGESVTVFKNQPLARSTVDRGLVMQKVFRAMSDTVDQILLRRAAGGSGGVGTTGTRSGDQGGTPAPTGGGPPPPPPHK
jgi:ferric-dicitrate binding protein FerR (iron transport regulator)